MSVDRTTPLVMDAAVLFAASHSPTGGSAYILLVCQFGYLSVVVSQAVLREAERNLLEKSTTQAFLRFWELVAETPFRLVPAPAESLVRGHESEFFEDAHVVAAAVASQARYLITLDQTLRRRIEQSRIPLLGHSPGAFIQEVLPEHPEYMRIRRRVT